MYHLQFHCNSHDYTYLHIFCLESTGIEKCVLSSWSYNHSSVSTNPTCFTPSILFKALDPKLVHHRKYGITAPQGNNGRKHSIWKTLSSADVPIPYFHTSFMLWDRFRSSARRPFASILLRYVLWRSAPVVLIFLNSLRNITAISAHSCHNNWEEHFFYFSHVMSND